MPFGLRNLTLVTLSIAILMVASTARGADFTFNLTENTMQPVKLPFLATPGVLLLCDTDGNNPAAPKQVNANPPPTGIWSCVRTINGVDFVREASDVLVFEPNPNDPLFPSRVSVCSDIDNVPDPGDPKVQLAVCRDPNDPNMLKLLPSGDYAIQESGVEGGREVTSYRTQPLGVGFPGFGTVKEGTNTLFLAYDIESDIPRTPQPPSILLIMAGLLALLSVPRRRAKPRPGRT
jgi:hypothetical protein